MLCVTTNRMSQAIRIKDTNISKETKSDYTNFDPFSSSPPPNTFLQNLNKRMQIYETRKDISDVRFNYLSHKK